VNGKRKVLNRSQSTCNILSEYLWIKEKDQLINSLFPKFPHIVCFSELEQISLEGYKFGAAYYRIYLPKGGVCIFVNKKYNYSNGDLSKYYKEQDIEACALKLELTTLVTIHRAPCGNFNLSLN
jgi:hypothetical protein